MFSLIFIKYTIYMQLKTFPMCSWTFNSPELLNFFTSLLKVYSFLHLICNWILQWHNDLTKTFFFRCIPLENFSYCYITLDSATTASQNGFWPRKLSFHGKTNIIQNMTKRYFLVIYSFIIGSSETRLLSHISHISLSHANTVLWCSRFRIHCYVAAPNFSIFCNLKELKIWTRK